MSDNTKLKEAILSVVADISNYPPDVQSRLWGADVANLAEKTFRAVKESGLVEDREYEYAVQTTDHTGKVFEVSEGGWVSTLEYAKIILDDRQSRWNDRGVDWSAKIIKRRKAGKVEDV